MVCAVAAGHDEQREDEQRAGDLARLGDGDAEQHEEEDDSSATGTPRAAATSGSTDANSSGRPITASTTSDGRADDQSSVVDLAVGDAEEAAEQQRVHAFEEPVVEGDEQEPAGERERLHGADHRGLLAEPVPAGPGIGGDDERGGDAEAEVAPRRADADQDGAGGAGERDDRQVWPAKVWRRSTMNQPMTAATTATIVPARKALTMKWNSKS